LRVLGESFAFRVDIWDDAGDSIVERVAGVDLPGSRGALARHAHQAARVIEEWLRVVSSQ